jgi:predicted aspartyl protease
VSIEYPLTEETTLYGPLLTPHISLEVSTVYGLRPFRFLLDTGAEFTVVPESLAESAGVDLSRCAKEYSLGIEGRPLPARVGSITIRLGSEVFPLRCHFLKAEHTPYLLGRMDLFTRFNIHFQNDQRRISFSRIG